MRVLMVCPKIESYALKDTETIRLMRATYKKWIEFVQQSGGTLRCFIEDNLACEIVKDLQIENVEYLTVMTRGYKVFLDSYKGKVYPEWDRITQMVPDAKLIEVSTKDRFPIPMVSQFTSREEYNTAKFEQINNASKLAISRFIKMTNAILMFRAGGNQNTFSSLLKHMHDGDGKLLMEVDLESGICSSYYGGTYLDNEVVKTIIENVR